MTFGRFWHPLGSRPRLSLCPKASSSTTFPWGLIPGTSRAMHKIVYAPLCLDWPALTVSSKRFYKPNSLSIRNTSESMFFALCRYLGKIWVLSHANLRTVPLKASQASVQCIPSACSSWRPQDLYFGCGIELTRLLNWRSFLKTWVAWFHVQLTSSKQRWSVWVRTGSGTRTGITQATVNLLGIFKVF